MNLVLAAAHRLGHEPEAPLSTTYVTFMVAMGSSLADSTWGASPPCASMLLTVISGWFMTAFTAFTAYRPLMCMLFAASRVSDGARAHRRHPHELFVKEEDETPDHGRTRGDKASIRDLLTESVRQPQRHAQHAQGLQAFWRSCAELKATPLFKKVITMRRASTTTWPLRAAARAPARDARNFYSAHSRA